MAGTRGSAERLPGRPEQRAAFVAGAVDHVLRTGVSTLSLRPLAAALGTSDRMLLYYFGSRERLVTEVLTAVGVQLEQHLEAALPADPVPPGELFERLDHALADDAVERSLRCYIEISGLAARRVEPFRSVAATVAQGWLGWIAPRLDVPEAERAAAAAGVLAVLDGLLLLRFLTSAEDAERAAAWVRARLGAAEQCDHGR